MTFSKLFSLESRKPVVQRILAGKSLEKVLYENLVIPIWIPSSFVAYADKLVESVVIDHPGLNITKVLDIIREGKKPVWSYDSGKEKTVLVNFTLSPIMMYQQLDRRLDEYVFLPHLSLPLILLYTNLFHADK